MDRDERAARRGRRTSASRSPTPPPPPPPLPPTGQGQVFSLYDKHAQYDATITTTN